MNSRFLKSFVLVLISLLIISSVSSVNAERAFKDTITAVSRDGIAEPAETVYHGNTASKNIYRTIILRYENNPAFEGDDVVTYITPVVAKITYEFYGAWSMAEERYSGGYVDLEGAWPQYEAVPHAIYELDVSFSNKNHPVNCSVTGNDAQQYIANAAGGTYQITYNKELVFDQYGQLKNVIPQTDTLVHSFTYTGGTASN